MYIVFVIIHNINNIGTKLQKKLCVRNMYTQIFTQSTFLGHFFTQTTLRVSIFTHK